MNAHATVGVDWQSTRHTSTPKGRFVPRADSIRPYSCGGRAADGSTDSRPLQSVAQNWYIPKRVCIKQKMKG